MRKLWTWLRDPLNLAVIVAIAGGLAFLWREVVEPRMPSPAAKAQVDQSQTATAGSGTAINARDSAAVNAAKPPESGGSAGASAANTVARQNAEAGAGGRAVNASGSSRVTVGSAGDDSKIR